MLQCNLWLSWDVLLHIVKHTLWLLTLGIVEPQVTGWMDKMRVIVVHTHNSLQQLMCRTDLNFIQQTVWRVSERNNATTKTLISIIESNSIKRQISFWESTTKYSAHKNSEMFLVCNKIKIFGVTEMCTTLLNKCTACIGRHMIPVLIEFICTVNAF